MTNTKINSPQLTAYFETEILFDFPCGLKINHSNESGTKPSRLLLCWYKFAEFFEIATQYV